MTADELSKALLNVGPVTARQLIAAGIDSPQKLKDLGAEAAFMQIITAGGYCGTYNATYLYALEGAIQNCDWRFIEESRKQEFKALTKKLRQKL